MSRNTTQPSVMTLAEAARYLRLPGEVVERLAHQGAIPARQIDGHWRFLRAAVDEWLGCCTRDGRAALLEQAGAFKDDETLPALLDAIYAARGRPEAAPRRKR